MDTLLKFTEENAAVIKAHWQIFVTFALLLYCAAYIYVRHQFKDRIESKDAQIALRDDIINNYERKTNSHSPDEAGKKINELETRLIALEPMLYTESQMTALEKALTGISGTIDISHVPGSRSAIQRYDQLIKVFKNSDLSLIEHGSKGSADERRGLFLKTFYKKNSDIEFPDSVIGIINAFEVADIPYSRKSLAWSGWHDDRVEEVWIVVNEIL